MRRWILLSVLVCLVAASGCASKRKVGLLNSDFPETRTVEAASVSDKPFDSQLEEFMQLPKEVRQDHRSQAEEKSEYFQRVARDNYESKDSLKRFWYYEDAYLDFSTRGIGVKNSIIGLKAATALDPSYAEGWAALGNLMIASGDQLKALEYLTNAKAAALACSKTGNPIAEGLMLRIYTDRAWVLRDLARWDEGLLAVREGLEFQHGFPDLVLIKGLLLAGAGRYNEARSLAVRMKPFEYEKVDYWYHGYSKTTSDFASRWIRSQALLARGEYEMARHVLGELDHREDQHFVPHMTRFWTDAGLIAELNNEERGSRYYALAFISRPYEGFYPWQGGNLKPLVLNVPDPRMPVYTSFGGRFMVGGSILTYAAYQMNNMFLTSFEKQKEAAAARALFALDIAERRNIRPAVCRAMRGRLYYSTNLLDMARVELEAAHKDFTAKGKVDGGTSLLLGMLEMGDGNNENAITLLQEAVTENDKLAAGWRTLGVLHARSGQVALAEAEMDKALLLEPNSVSGLYNRGLLRMQDKRFVESVADLEKAFKLDPENHEVQRVLQMAATSYRANGGNPSQLRLDVQEYQVVASSEGPPADLVADPTALVAQLNAEIKAFFSVPDSIAAKLSPDDAVLTVLADEYAESGDPDVRRALALEYLDRGMNSEAQALLAPGWGVDLLPGEEIMLLYVDRLLGQEERGNDLAKALISGETFTDNRHLMSLLSDYSRLPWWKNPMNGGHYYESYDARVVGNGDNARMKFMMSVNYNAMRVANHRVGRYMESILPRWFFEVRGAGDGAGNTQASAVNGGSPTSKRKAGNVWK